MAKTPSLSERAERLEALWFQLVGDPDNPKIPGALQIEARENGSLASSHVISGDTLARTETPQTQEDIQITMGDTF
jgi:hypothetical protein